MQHDGPLIPKRAAFAPVPVFIVLWDTTLVQRFSDGNLAYRRFFRTADVK